MTIIEEIIVNHLFLHCFFASDYPKTRYVTRPIRQFFKATPSFHLKGGVLLAKRPPPFRFTFPTSLNQPRL